MLKNAIAFIKIFTKFKKIKAEDKSFSFEVYKRIIKKHSIYHNYTDKTKGIFVYL